MTDPMTTPPLDLPALHPSLAEAVARGDAAYGSGGDAEAVALAAAAPLLDRLEAAERDLAAVTVSRDGWQTRAEAAEKKVAAVETLTDHYAALIDTMPEPHGVVTRTQEIFVRDIHQALDHHNPETETT